MDNCGNCGHQLDANSRFCNRCGAQIARQAEPQRQYAPTYPQGGNAAQTIPTQPSPTYQGGGLSPHHIAARGFAQTFGLHPAAALLTVIVNTMLFGAAGVAGLISVPTAGTSLVALTAVSTVCGIILGYITYMVQQKWYDDDKESARIKALIVAFLTAIPVGLPGYLTIPSGIIGFFRRKTDK